MRSTCNYTFIIVTSQRALATECGSDCVITHAHCVWCNNDNDNDNDDGDDDDDDFARALIDGCGTNGWLALCAVMYVKRDDVAAVYARAC